MDFLSQMQALAGIDMGPQHGPEQAEEGWAFYGWHTRVTTQLLSCKGPDGKQYAGSWHPENKAWIIYAPLGLESAFTTEWNTNGYHDDDARTSGTFWQFGGVRNPFFKS